MKSLRAISPFRRRKTVAELVDDVRRAEMATGVPPSSAEFHQRKGLAATTPDTSRESGEGGGRRSQRLRCGQSRSPPRYRSNQIDDFLSDARGGESERGGAKVTARPTSARSSSSNRRSAAGAAAARSNPISSATTNSNNRVAAGNIVDAGRSKSPFPRRKGAEKMDEDDGRSRLERSADFSSPSRSGFIPGQSCRTSPSSRDVKGSPFEESPESRGGESVASRSIGNGRSRSPFQRWRKAKDMVNEINALGAQYKEDHVHPFKPTSDRRSYSPTPSKSERSGRSVERSISRSRSRSPYLQRKNAVDLIRDIRKVEVDYTSRAVDLSSECSAVEVVIGASPDRSRKPMLVRGKKSLLALQSQDRDGLLTTDRIGQKTLSTTSTDLQLTATPDWRTNQSGRVKVPFRAQLPVVTGKTKTRNFREKKRAIATVTQVDQTTSATRPLDMERQKVTISRLDKPSVVPPSSIALGRRSHISELSLPPTALGHERSLGLESVAEIQSALSKVQNELKGAAASGSKVSRFLVMKTLLQVADTIESKEDRALVRQKLSEVSTRAGNSRADSTSTTSAYRRSKEEDEPRKSGDVDETSGDTSTDTGTADDDSDESSFAEWINQKENTNIQWSGILAMLGLTDLWDDGEADSGDEKAKDVARLISDHEDDIRTPPLIEKMSFTDYVARITMMKSTQEEGSASPRKGIEEAARRAPLEDESRTKQKIAKEERMMRELEILKQRMRRKSATEERGLPVVLPQKLKRLASEMKKENEALGRSGKPAEVLQRASNGATISMQTSFGHLLAFANRSRSKFEEGQSKQQLISGVERAPRDRTPRSDNIRVGGSPTVDDSRQLKTATSESLGSLVSARSSLSRALSSDTETTTGPHPLPQRSDQWPWGQLRTQRSPTAETGAAFEVVVMPRPASSDVEDGLSLDSIESHQFINTTAPINQRRRNVDEETRVEEASMSYTQKMVQRKSLKATETMARNAVHSTPGAGGDEERSDKSKASRARSRMSRKRHNKA